MISIETEVKYPLVVEVPVKYWTFSIFFEVDVEYLNRNYKK